MVVWGLCGCVVETAGVFKVCIRSLPAPARIASRVGVLILGMVVVIGRAGSGAGHERGEIFRHSDNIEFPFPVNAGTKGEFVGMSVDAIEFTANS